MGNNFSAITSSMLFGWLSLLFLLLLLLLSSFLYHNHRLKYRSIFKFCGNLWPTLHRRQETFALFIFKIFINNRKRGYLASFRWCTIKGETIIPQTNSQTQKRRKKKERRKKERRKKEERRMVVCSLWVIVKFMWSLTFPCLLLE